MRRSRRRQRRLGLERPRVGFRLDRGGHLVDAVVDEAVEGDRRALGDGGEGRIKRGLHALRRRQDRRADIAVETCQAN